MRAFLVFSTGAVTYARVCRKMANLRSLVVKRSLKRVQKVKRSLRKRVRVTVKKRAAVKVKTKMRKM